MAKFNIKSKFKALVDKVRNFYKRTQRSYYDLWDEIQKHKWAKLPQPHIAAQEWFNEYARDPKVRYNNKMLNQGQLYIYNYDTPKYEDELDFFDSQPLAICLGSQNTKQGLRDVCVNLHMLPPAVRRFVMHEIYNMFKEYYEKNLYQNNQKAVEVSWKKIKAPLEQFGIDFAIRMYIPELRKETIEFKQEDWASAVYIKSKGYRKMSAREIEKRYREHMAKLPISPAGAESF